MRILHSITIRKASSRRSLMSPCYKTISSCCSCAYVEILSTWEVWRALKRLELHSAAPRATLTPLSCSPNFPRAQYLDIRTLMHELIVKHPLFFHDFLKVLKFVYGDLMFSLNSSLVRIISAVILSYKVVFG